MIAGAVHVGQVLLRVADLVGGGVARIVSRPTVLGPVTNNATRMVTSVTRATRTTVIWRDVLSIFGDLQTARSIIFSSVGTHRLRLKLDAHGFVVEALLLHLFDWLRSALIRPALWNREKHALGELNNKQIADDNVGDNSFIVSTESAPHLDKLRSRNTAIA